MDATAVIMRLSQRSGSLSLNLCFARAVLGLANTFSDESDRNLAIVAYNGGSIQCCDQESG
jgi:hypothetical protein